jgi:hypothetical protein
MGDEAEQIRWSKVLTWWQTGDREEGTIDKMCPQRPTSLHRPPSQSFQ